MKVRYALLGAIFVGLVACEQPKKKEEAQKPQESAKTEQAAKAEAPKTETKPQATAQASGSAVDKGKAIFTKKGCNSCHQPTADTVGPSLKKIAQAYNSVEELVKYLKGEAEPKVDPAKANIMNPQLGQLKDLSEEDLKALAEFILSHK